MRMTLSSAELRRYARHVILPQVGVAGQERLKASSVLVVGLGGLGSPAALYLAAAGVGRLGLVDFDRVDESNLQRQVMHGTSSVGVAKTESARARLHDLNPHVELRTHDEPLTTANALALIGAYDVVVDGTDQFATRYLVNDACVIARRPNVYGSVHRFEGQVSVFATEGGPCYRCLFPEPPPVGTIPSCAEGACWAYFPASWVHCRLPRPSSWFWASAHRWRAGCCTSTCSRCACGKCRLIVTRRARCAVTVPCRGCSQTMRPFVELLQTAPNGP